MPNLRIISDNAADRAVVVATPSVASLPASNLLQDNKFAVCRGTTLSMAISATWTSTETIRAVALPFTNLSPTATMRVKLTNEVQATNLALYSQQLTNAAWYTYQVTVTPSGTVPAPDGTMTAYRVANAGASEQSLKSSIGQGTQGVTYTASIFAKSGERSTFMGVVSGNLLSGSGAATFDLSKGTVSATASLLSASITPVGNGWFRCAWTFTATATAVSNTVWVNLGMPLSDNTQGIYLWGAQLETGPTATSYYQSTSTASTRPTGYIDSWQTYQYDSGHVTCCPAPATKLRGWTASAAASAYGYGGGSCATLWIPSAKVATGLRVDIVDTNNLQGYIEVSRLIIGDYWEPTDGAEAGASISVVDNSKHTRTEAGSMLTEVGTRFRKQSLSMPCLNETDRQALWSILMAGGIASPIFISVYPDNANKALEKAHAMYGKLVTTPVMTQPYFNIATATLEIEEV